MSNVIYISDSFIEDNLGGAELVDETIIRSISGCIKVKSNEACNFYPNDKIIISNISLMPQQFVDRLSRHPNYIIVEHDYKICRSRWPWQYPNNIVPKTERINYDLYKNAKKVYVQTTDHLNVFKANDVEANFYNLECSIWSNEELNCLRHYAKFKNNPINGRFAIIESGNWIKNTNGAVKFCQENQLDYDLVKPNKLWHLLIHDLAKYPALVFFPIARESCCRLVVEARAIGMNVITTKNYGAVLEPWFKLSGEDLISLLKEKSDRNLEDLK